MRHFESGITPASLLDKFLKFKLSSCRKKSRGQSETKIEGTFTVLMITNKIIDVLITITSWIVVPLGLVTTFLLGLLVTITFGILLMPLTFIWIALFFGPLLGLSYIWERAPFTRLLISIIGIPLAVIANAFVCLIPSMGEIESRVVKLLYCQTFPYTWRFHQFHNRKLNLDSNDALVNIFERVSKDITIRRYLNFFIGEDAANK